MWYCFVCRECGSTIERRDNIQPLCQTCDTDVVMQRDYRAENAAPQTLQLKREREAGGRSAVRDLFLPTAKDFENPSDPDGEKGLRAWADEQRPKDGNKRPYWPDMKKKTYAVGGK